jgi:seryl-tRNA synthetase
MSDPNSKIGFRARIANVGHGLITHENLSDLEREKNRLSVEVQQLIKENKTMRETISKEEEELREVREEIHLQKKRELEDKSAVIHEFSHAYDTKMGEFMNKLNRYIEQQTHLRHPVERKGFVGMYAGNKKQQPEEAPIPKPEYPRALELLRDIDARYLVHPRSHAPLSAANNNGAPRRREAESPEEEEAHGNARDSSQVLLTRRDAAKFLDFRKWYNNSR